MAFNEFQSFARTKLSLVGVGCLRGVVALVKRSVWGTRHRG
jgi:hypothetical protein